MIRAPHPNANRQRRRSPIRVAALVVVTLVSAVLLTGCHSAPDNPRLDWTPDGRCPSTATVGAVSGLDSLHFTVKTVHAETPRSTGCSYLDRSDNIQLDLVVEPGPPSDVQFGSASGIVDAQKPSLGAGAHLGVSPTYCSIAVPETPDRTIQLEIIAGVGESKPEAHACAMLVPLLERFATRKGSSE